MVHEPSCGPRSLHNRAVAGVVHSPERPARPAVGGGPERRCLQTTAPTRQETAHDRHLVTLQGNLGGDVRLRQGRRDAGRRLPGGAGHRASATATDRVGRRRTTPWYSVIAWRGLARNCATPCTARLVVVHGRLTPRSTSTTTDGGLRPRGHGPELRRSRPQPWHHDVPAQQQSAANAGARRRGRVSRRRPYFSALSSPVRTARKASSSPWTGADHQLGRDLLHGSAEPAVGRGRALAGGDVHQGPAHLRAAARPRPRRPAAGSACRCPARTAPGHRPATPRPPALRSTPPRPGAARSAATGAAAPVPARSGSARRPRSVPP